MLDIKEVSMLYKLFKDSNIGEIEIHNKNNKIRLTLGSEPFIPNETIIPQKPIEESKIEEVKVEEINKEESPEETNIYELKSKWVGFFTRLNPKTGENYIKLRDNVKKGSIVGHIRVLGVLQDLKVEHDCKVKEILVEEGQPIEYGQPLMRFEI